MKFKKFTLFHPTLLRISSQDNKRKLNFCFIKNETLSILFVFLFLSDLRAEKNFKAVYR